MTDADLTLLPCPFCGEKAQIVGNSYPGDNPIVNCSGADCACMGDFTVEQWNRRSPAPPTADQPGEGG